MFILVACEESQRVCKEFREKGHNAFSCDIIPTSGDFPEFHIIQDVLPLLDGNCDFMTESGDFHHVDKWDMIIAFPPCTHLAVSGAMHFEKKRENGQQLEAIEFFARFINAKCDKIVVENPIGIISGNYIKEHFPDICKTHNLPKEPSQIIQPWMFGDNYRKSTCLWIKGLPNLIPEVTEEPELEFFEWLDKNGKKKRQPKWYYDALKYGKDRAKMRSKTFLGIARAMAEQWG